MKLEPPKINPKRKLDFDPNNPWHVEAVARAPEFHNKLIEEHVTELFMNKTVGFQVWLAYFFSLTKYIILVHFRKRFVRWMDRYCTRYDLD